jgi:hypothetical protein
MMGRRTPRGGESTSTVDPGHSPQDADPEAEDLRRLAEMKRDLHLTELFSKTLEEHNAQLKRLLAQERDEISLQRQRVEIRVEALRARLKAWTQLLAPVFAVGGGIALASVVKRFALRAGRRH